MLRLILRQVETVSHFLVVIDPVSYLTSFGEAATLKKIFVVTNLAEPVSGNLE